MTDAPDPAELEELLRRYSGSVAYDLGAHVGYTAELLSEAFELVVACEPHPVSYAALSKRAFPRRAETHPLAVDDTGGWTPVQCRAVKDLDGQYTNAAAPWPEWGEVQRRLRVKSTTVDQLREIHGPPDLLKIDVEGGELRVIKGAQFTLHRDRPDLYIEVHGDKLGAEIRRLLEPLYPPHPVSGLRVVPHPHYEPGSWHAENHYWLISGPAAGW